jgi:hypothetical protein
MDEQNHLARGLAYLRTGDLRLSQEHPPGINAWQAWPAALDPNVTLPLDDPSWAMAEWYGFADRLLWRANANPQAMVFAARVPVMWLTVILASLAYRWARELGGRSAGIGALVLCAFDPNLLAHGRLVTNDLGMTCLSLLAIWALWRALRGQSIDRWVLAGLALGAAQLAKFSALVLVPVTLFVGMLWLGDEWRRGCGLQSALIGRWILRLVVLFGVCGLTVWAGYGFAWGSIGFLNGLHGPAPMYWSGIEAIMRRTAGGTSAFLMGQYSSTGWWYYFPLAFAIKTPLPTLIALGAAAALMARTWWLRRRLDGLLAHGALDLLVLVLPPLSYWGVAVTGSFNIGYRHLLPSLPFFYVLAGWQISVAAKERVRSDRLNRKWGWIGATAAVALICWLVAQTVIIAPHYLAYFNQIAGGPWGGYRYLVDSNLDWGQDLPGLVRYVETSGIDRVNLAWFGAAHPEAYDLAFHPLPGFWRFSGGPAEYGLNPELPAPGIYAISASNLQGVAFQDHDLYAWFRAQTPVARVGYSILIYDVEGERQDEGTVVLGVPMDDLSGPERALLKRGVSVRHFDPTHGLIVPEHGPTWFVVPEPLAWGRVVRSDDGYLVVQGEPPLAAGGDRRARFGEFVDLINYQVELHGEGQGGSMQVRAEWSVVTPPHRAVVSFAHLLDGDGRYVAGWDGLSAPATCWQAGDHIVQRYAIPVPADVAGGTYQVELGWYDAETLERWPFYVDGHLSGDRLLTDPVELRQ